ncbi:hypothetical protein FI667_g2638, partial [Globisporangium splendens]
MDISAGRPSPSRSRSSSHQHGGGFSRSGRSLVALKAHFRRLRVFADVVKVLLVSLKEISTAKEGTPENQVQYDRVAQQRCTSVARISSDDTALKTVQSQVKSLVEQGYTSFTAACTLLRSPTALEFFSVGMSSRNWMLKCATRSRIVIKATWSITQTFVPGNLRKRAAMETHPRMVALTRRLWLTVVQGEDATMSFSEYEDLMLHLHRLILPQFDLTSSRNLIQADWTRDANGADHLDYRFLHLSMFELVGERILSDRDTLTIRCWLPCLCFVIADLWTDTVESEDVRGNAGSRESPGRLLFFESNPLHLCMPVPVHFVVVLHHVDILDKSKAISMEAIVQDLDTEVNSAVVQMYRDRILQDDEHEEDLKLANDQSKPPDEPGQQREIPLESSGTAETPDPVSATLSMDDSGGTISSGDQQLDQDGAVDTDLRASSPTATQRDPNRPRTSDPSSAQGNAVVADSLTGRDSNGNMGISLSHLNVQGKGKGGSHMESLASLAKGVVANPFTNNKTSGVVLSIGTIDGSNFISNMVVKPSIASKPSGLSHSSMAGRGVNWRDFYDASHNNTRKGSSLQEILRGSKVDTSRFGGAAQSSRLTPPEGVGLSLESVRLNQENSPRSEPQRQSQSLKVNEQHDAGHTVKEAVLSMQPLSISSMAGVSPRSRSASYQRPLPSPKRGSTQGSDGGSQYCFADVELSGAGAGLQNAMRSSANSGSTLRQHLEPQQNHSATKPLSPRQSRMLQQGRGSAATPQLLDGLLGLSITAPAVTSQSTSPAARSPRHQSIEQPAIGCSCVTTGDSIASTTSAAFDTETEPAFGSGARKSMLVTSTQRRSQQQQLSGAGLTQLSVQSAPISSRK